MPLQLEENKYDSICNKLEDLRIGESNKLVEICRMTVYSYLTENEIIRIAARVSRSERKMLLRYK